MGAGPCLDLCERVGCERHAADQSAALASVRGVGRPQSPGCTAVQQRTAQYSSVQQTYSTYSTAAQPTSTAQYSLCESAKNISSTDMCVHMSCVVHVRLHVNVQVLFSFIVRILGVIIRLPPHTRVAAWQACAACACCFLPVHAAYTRRVRSGQIHVEGGAAVAEWTSRRATASSPSHGSTLIYRLSCSGR